MAQQTAVDWLVYELERCGYFEINDRFPITFEQAKQMEKEQIIKAASTVLWNNSSNSTESAEQYYNETFGQGSSDTSPNTQNK